MFSQSTQLFKYIKINMVPMPFWKLSKEKESIFYHIELARKEDRWKGDFHRIIAAHSIGALAYKIP